MGRGRSGLTGLLMDGLARLSGVWLSPSRLQATGVGASAVARLRQEEEEVLGLSCWASRSVEISFSSDCSTEEADK